MNNKQRQDRYNEKMGAKLDKSNSYPSPTSLIGAQNFLKSLSLSENKKDDNVKEPSNVECSFKS